MRFGRGKGQRRHMFPGIQPTPNSISYNGDFNCKSTKEYITSRHASADTRSRTAFRHANKKYTFRHREKRGNVTVMSLKHCSRDSYLLYRYLDLIRNIRNWARIFYPFHWIRFPFLFFLSPVTDNGKHLCIKGPSPKSTPFPEGAKPGYL